MERSTGSTMTSQRHRPVLMAGCQRSVVAWLLARTKRICCNAKQQARYTSMQWTHRSTCNGLQCILFIWLDSNAALKHL